MVGTVLAQLRIVAAVQSKAQRRPAEYDHFGGVGISMAGQSKSPSNPLLPEHRIHVLLLSANDLVLSATNLRNEACCAWVAAITRSKLKKRFCNHY